jgi:MFS family permease
MVSPVRARGILGMALIWAIGLSTFATTLLIGGVLLGLVPSSLYGIRELVAVAVRAFAFGVGVGALFAVLLSWRERGKGLSALTGRQVGALGFVAGAALGAALALAGPVVLPAAVLVAAIGGWGLIGAGLSVGLLKVARRTPVLVGRDPEPRNLPAAF